MACTNTHWTITHHTQLNMQSLLPLIKAERSKNTLSKVCNIIHYCAEMQTFAAKSEQLSRCILQKTAEVRVHIFHFNLPY